MIPNKREGNCSQGEASMVQTAFASLFQADCARECHSNCNGKATTEFVNNGSNINGKFTAIKKTLTTREALSSQDNTRCYCSTTGIQPGVSNPVLCSASGVKAA